MKSLRAALFLLLIAACSGGHKERLTESQAPAESLDEEGGEALEVADNRFQTFAGPSGGVPAGVREPKSEESRPAALKTWKRSQIVPNTTKLSVGDKEELPLEGMSATVRIEGFRARVVLDCFFRNDRENQLEGTFKVRLPNEATPYYLAFGEMQIERSEIQVGGYTELAALRAHHAEGAKTIKEARVVPRKKAAHAYTETVRRKIDPALLEWAGAGVFNARVFPLLPGKLHRIVIGYEVNLLPVGAELEYRLDLPESIPDLRVSMMVEGGAHDVTPPPQVGLGTYHWTNPVERSFVVRMTEPGAILLEGKDDAVGRCFAAQFRPELPESEAETSPRGIFLVDVSLSSNPERFNVWLKLLEAILERNRESMTEFAVVFFNVETFAWREGFVANTPENVQALLADGGKLALEGATDLAAALNAAAAYEEDADVFLLSDGAPTWGENDLHAVALRAAKDRPIFAYRTGFSGTDARMLEFLARETGGAVFSVVGEEEVAAAAVAHTHRPWRLHSVTVEGGTDELVEGRPSTLFPGQTLRVAGRGTPADKLALTVSQDSTDIRRMTVPFTKRIDSELARGLYGQIAVGQLEELAHAAEETARAYATHFRIVGRTCSLLMLESDEEYESFNIKPEEDAFVVGERPAGATVRATLEKLGAALSDPKARFLAWLERLESTPGVEFETPGALRIALDKIPAEAFRVDPGPLICSTRDWKSIPGSVQEQLASRKLTYDSIMAEAGRRQEEIGTADALKALSSLVEHSPGDLVLTRDVGFTAMNWGLPGQAYHLFRRAADSRPDQPQTYRAMARCLAGMGKTDLALVCYEIAFAAKWDGRYGDFHAINSFDYLSFLRRIDTGELASSVPDYAAARLGTLRQSVKPTRADLVAIIEWNTDRTDVDLHVIDPNGEECFYSHPETKIGGKITDDVTQGFGPEMFVLERAIKGDYAIRVKYFSSDALRVSARTRVFATVYENWGRPDERAQRKAVTLAYGQEMHDVAVVTR